MASSNRARNFATIVYPESAPTDWIDILSAQLVPSLVSPLHDKDVNSDGSVKKEHHHVIVMFEGVKTPEQVKEIFVSFGGVGLEVVKSLKSHARYLCHLDNSDKVQYSPEDVKCFGGADYNAVIGLASDKYKAVREMIKFCNDNGIIAYSDLLEYCSEHRFDWFKVLCDNGTLIIKEYLKSKNWKNSI